MTPCSVQTGGEETSFTLCESLTSGRIEVGLKLLLKPSITLYNAER